VSPFACIFMVFPPCRPRLGFYPCALGRAWRRHGIFLEISLRTIRVPAGAQASVRRRDSPLVPTSPGQAAEQPAIAKK
jgi:hypothetical protein